MCHLSKGYWEKSIWQEISIVTLPKLFWKMNFVSVMEVIFGGKNILVDGNDRKKSQCLVGFLLLFWPGLQVLFFAMSFRVTDTAAHQTIVDFEIHKTLSNLSILTIRAITLTILKKKNLGLHLFSSIMPSGEKIKTKFWTYLVSYLTHLFFVIRSPAIWPRILWFVNSWNTCGDVISI